MFSQNLITLRTQKGWSQQALADRLGISSETVAAWENGRATPDLDTILALSELFDVSTDLLLKEESDAFAKKHTAFPWLIVIYWMVVTVFDLFCHFILKETNSSRFIWIGAGILFAVIVLVYSLWDIRKKK